MGIFCWFLVSLHFGLHEAEMRAKYQGARYIETGRALSVPWRISQLRPKQKSVILRKILLEIPTQIRLNHLSE